MSKDLEKLLSKYSPEVRGLALKVRKLIRSVVPKAQEKMYLGWKTIGYSVDGTMKGTVCSIGPQRAYVNIYFFSGADLDDPNGLLDSSGKKVRHVKIKEAKDVQAKALKLLIKDAAALARSAQSGIGKKKG